MTEPDFNTCLCRTVPTQQAPDAPDAPPDAPYGDPSGDPPNRPVPSGASEQGTVRDKRALKRRLQPLNGDLIPQHRPTVRCVRCLYPLESKGGGKEQYTAVNGVKTGEIGGK
jgi:hypothetical protein